MAKAAKPVKARVFWSGGSQAVRLPKSVRVTATEVIVTRKGDALLLEPVAERDDWEGFWDRLVPLDEPVKRWPTADVEKRRPF